MHASIIEHSVHVGNSSFIFQLKVDFLQLLKEQSDLDRHSRWSETKKKIDSDSRYKAVDSSTRREDWFRDYVKTLDDVSLNCSSLTNRSYVYQKLQ